MTETYAGATRGAPTRPGAGRPRRQGRAGYLFLAPSLLFFTVFLILPSLFAIFLSLSQWGGYDLTQITFIGVRNYGDILNFDSTFLSPILVNTLLFAALSVIPAVAGSLLVAQCIERLRFQGFWRFLYFLPVVATVVAIGNVWKMMYQPSGLINGILNMLHINSIGFLSDPTAALPSVAVVQAWASIGSAVLILTAGIKAIDRTVYEAAEIDGANSWNTFWGITLPLLRPSLLFVFITQCIAGMQSFALIIVMTKDGGPANATNVAAFEMYQQAFRFGAWGTASAMAMVLFVIIFVATLIQLWIGRRAGEDD
ncbi:sugar ABC transporter permease [Acrocarpospora macrocephala]|uniref:Sugar ABC transporter permease n=1 Tax=Acrocarpospora macrocephala TaxID=150177 RepID=A0A5M3WD86_9ACTN|nr:sugar ABC transporter permease [Acrocarpospora macrocephala]GES06786.1 sugar ABC transporter permease [Acrocarpospora macrocephala]